jgi:hypothetical protein
MSKFVSIGTVLLLLTTGVSVFAQAPGEWSWQDMGGFSLAYPNTWELVQFEGLTQLRYTSYALNIHTREVQMGLPAGDFERHKFIGRYGIPVDLLVYQGGIKEVLYGRVQGPDVTLIIVLASLTESDVAYEDIAIPPDVVDQANRIVGTLTLNDADMANVSITPLFSGEVNPIDTWQTYSHPTEPFGFRYPSTWTLQEEVGRLALVRDGVSFVIAYNPIGTQTPMFDPELWNSGNLETRVPIYGLHQAIPSQAVDLQNDGSAAGVIYEPILTPDNQFVMWVSADTRLDTTTMDEIDMMISTFKTRLPERATRPN